MVCEEHISSSFTSSATSSPFNYNDDQCHKQCKESVSACVGVVVHIVDLSGPYANPGQWLSLLHSIRHQANPSPHLRITVVHDDVDFLRHMPTRLTAVPANYRMSFQFHSFEARLDTLDFDKLHVKSGEAVAITSLFNLHRLLLTADSKNRPSYIPYPTLSLATFGDLLRDDHGHNHTKLLIDSFLSSLHALSPKVTMIAEQEANHNGEICQRFAEAINYYASMRVLLSYSGCEGLKVREKNGCFFFCWKRDHSSLLQLGGLQYKVLIERVLCLIGFSK